MNFPFFHPYQHWSLILSHSLVLEILFINCNNIAPELIYGASMLNGPVIPTMIFSYIQREYYNWNFVHTAYFHHSKDNGVAFFVMHTKLILWECSKISAMVSHGVPHFPCAVPLYLQ